ncbi:MAG: hypothetical protein LBH86_04105 [Oscillospiraceae bacterium]|jgi:hypothetical protein|nr:hypothetical protein [Oscillospiraceae bacterium]
MILQLAATKQQSKRRNSLVDFVFDFSDFIPYGDSECDTNIHHSDNFLEVISDLCQSIIPAGQRVRVKTLQGGLGSFDGEPHSQSRELFVVLPWEINILCCMILIVVSA